MSPPPPLVVGNISELSDRDLSALSERATSRSSPVSPEAQSSPPERHGVQSPPRSTESTPAKPGSASRTGVPSLGLGLSLETRWRGADSLAQRVAQRRQLAAGLRSERRSSPKEAGSLTATSPRARGADVPPETRLSEGGLVDPSISPPRSLESLPQQRSHSRARPQTIKLSERLPLLCTPMLPTPQGIVPLHKPLPSPRDACAVHAIVAPSPSGASPAAAASRDAPAAEEEHAAVATDDLRQLASRFWAGVGLMVLGADEPPSSAVAVGASALSVMSELSGFG